MNHFTASDGTRIAYRDEGTGTPLVLLHGLMAHGGFFRAQADLAADFRVIAIDLRGHGASARAGERPTVEQLAGDVSELAEALDLSGAIGVGWSMGATVLWHVLSGPAASRFAGSVVVDMTARVRNDAEWDLGLSPEACEARSNAIRVSKCEPDPNSMFSCELCNQCMIATKLGIPRSLVTSSTQSRRPVSASWVCRSRT